MRVSIPGLPGVYYDTDSGSSAIGVASTAIGRRAPKPKGYAIQLLPYLWSFDVDLREVPNDHPIQYLHPEGAQSLGELSPQRGVREAGNELESVLRFVWSINQEVESTANQLIGGGADEDGVVIEIEDGRVSVDGDELATDEFDLEEPSTGSTGTESVTGTGSVTNVEITEGTNVIDSGDTVDREPIDETDGNEGDEAETHSSGERDADADAADDSDADEDVFGATEEPPADEDFGSDTDDEFGADGDGDDS